MPEFMARDDHGYIHLRDHRVGLQDIVHFYHEGDSPEMLRLRFPTLSLPLIHKVLAFYLENTTDVDAYCRQQAAEVARQRAAASTRPSLEELRRRREASRLSQGV